MNSVFSLGLTLKAVFQFFTQPFSTTFEIVTYAKYGKEYSWSNYTLFIYKPNELINYCF